MNNICFSGGADGADQVWGKFACFSGHKVVHFSFKGHNIFKPDYTLPYYIRPPLTEIVILSEDNLERAEDDLKIACKDLHKNFPTNPYTKNLLRRNWYQIINSKVVYAISTIKNGFVEGGTAYAVKMFINRNRINTLPVFVYDQNVCKWYTWENGEFRQTNEIPKPSGLYTGIGTRNLTYDGYDAIVNLYTK